MPTLVIVESPSKAKNITKYLGKEYVVRPTYGHIFELVSRDVGNLKFGINIDGGFVPKYSIISEKAIYVKAILDIAAKCNKILIASDPDREGEAIAFHVAEILKKFKDKEIKRVLFKSMTKKAIIEAVQNPTELDPLLYKAQQARRIIDRVVGFSVSPLLWNLYGQKLSAGRVQSVALRLIVEREIEIHKFNSEEYWNLFFNFKKDSKIKAKYCGKISSKNQLDNILEKVNDDIFDIIEVLNAEKEVPADPPFITSTMAAAAAGFLKFPAKKTMTSAQSLYENGYVTYIRTDSVRVSEEAIQDCSKWLTEQGYLSQNKVFKVKGTAQDAHEAIRPTDVFLTPDKIFVSREDIKLYKLIWERFVASQMPSAIYDTSTILLEGRNSKLRFKLVGKVLKDPGWKKITSGYEDYDDKESILPVFEVGESYQASKLSFSFDKKATQPPSRFSERTMIKELERRGIGRPSTYQFILEKLSKKDFVDNRDGIFYAKNVGLKVVEFLIGKFKFMDPNYTALMEKKLDMMAAGNVGYVEMLSSFYNELIPELEGAKKLQKVHDFGYTCPHCKSNLELRWWHKDSFLVCPSYPTCSHVMNVKFKDGEIICSDKKQDVIYDKFKCEKCNSDLLKKNGRYGPFVVCVNKTCGFKKAIPTDRLCSSCGGDTFYYKNVNTVYLRCGKCHKIEFSEPYVPEPIILQNVIDYCQEDSK
jgi:DNA topoisomerase-1